MRLDIRHHLIPASLLLLGVLAALIVSYLTPLRYVRVLPPELEKVAPQSFYDSYTKDPEKYLLIDIRADEFRGQEYPEGSLHIPLSVIAGEVNALPKDKSIVIFCESNFSAGAAYFVLQDHGFTNIQIVDGGRDAWKRAGLPLVQASDESKRLSQEMIALHRLLLKVVK